MLTAFLCFVVATNRAETVLRLADEQCITDHWKIQPRTVNYRLSGNSGADKGFKYMKF